MELVRNDSHVTVLSPSDFDFYEVLNDVRLMFARRAEAQGLTLDIDHTPDVPQFLCTDQGKVRQILVNLIGNALKFTGKGGVRLSARNLHQNASDEILLSVDVEDTGCGIREDEMGAIFNAFEQTEYGRKTGKGTGLGLPLSRLYAQALGGNVTVTSQPGEGSCFHFTFHARPAKTVSGQLRQNVVLRLKPNQRPCHILTVDDDVSNRDMLAIMLKAVGFNVETADNAFQTLHRLRQPGKIDLLLMDKQMPEMDGFEAIRRIRDLPGGLGIPVLVVTAAGFTEQREQALAAGANGHVSKPVRREQLLEEIARVVGVQYEYEQPPPAGPSTSPLPDLSPDELARLPAETSRSLAQALRRGDIHLLRQLVDTLSHDQPGLAAGLRSLVDAYDYNRLHRLLAAAKGESV
jgi:CheY-like chemotaxis protein